MAVVFYHKPMRAVNYCRGCGREMRNRCNYFCSSETCQALKMSYRFCIQRWNQKQWYNTHRDKIWAWTSNYKKTRRTDPGYRARENQRLLERYRVHMQDPAWHARRSRYVREYRRSRRDSECVTRAVEAYTAHAFAICAGTAEIETWAEVKSQSLVMRCFREVLNAGNEFPVK